MKPRSAVAGETIEMGELTLLKRPQSPLRVLQTPELANPRKQYTVGCDVIGRECVVPSSRRPAPSVRETHRERRAAVDRTKIMWPAEWSAQSNLSCAARKIDRGSRKPIESLDACDMYLRALAVRHQYTEKSIREAIDRIAETGAKGANLAGRPRSG